MFTENHQVRQRPDEGFRRWFLAADMDLILWYESEAGPLTGYQLCYDKKGEEKALTWKIEAGREIRSHRFVSYSSGRTGSTPGYDHAMTAILRGDAGQVLARGILAELQASPQLPAEAVEHIKADLEA